VTTPDPVESRADNAFGLLLRELREQAGLTQEELAERARLTAYAVGSLERGRRQRPYPNTVRSLADALGATDEQRSRLVRAVQRRTPAAPAREPAVTASPVEVPAPRSTPPQPVTRLLGRDRELTALRELVLSGEQRLITLTGTGGVGKTRLAGELAHQLADVFADGAAVVSLAPLSDPGAVLPAVARAVGCAVGEGPEAEQQLADHLAPLRLLLVLDNLEHLLAAAQQIAALVSRCPRTVVLVTSRAPLRVRGEAEFPVQPLAVPQAGGDDPTALASCPAVEVFVDRARAVSPGFSVTADNAGPVADLCRRLAGIPLALELAAARLRFLNPQALLARLDEAMARAGGPDLPARQRTLQATFDWSYDLLDGQEQALLRLLSVFAGGCGLEAVEELCAVLGRREPVLPLLEVLVEHSLVVVGTDSEGAPRFSLLEPVAQYARSRQDPAEARATRAAHAAVQLARAERAAPEYLAADQVVWFDRASARTPTASPPSPGRWTPGTPRRPGGSAGRCGCSGGRAAGCSPGAG
jgi:predicted ATPase/DNA-binding XRE family transcriptional regulator